MSLTGSTIRLRSCPLVGRAGPDSSTELPKQSRTLAERHSGELVVVACHGGVIEATMLAFLPMATA